MGKLTGYILGVSGALLVSFYILSAYYMPLINWLGPYFGAPLVFILPILFLILGNQYSADSPGASSSSTVSTDLWVYIFSPSFSGGQWMSALYFNESYSAVVQGLPSC